MLHRSKKIGTCAMFFDPPRTLAFWLINGIPAAALTLIIAALRVCTRINPLLRLGLSDEPA
jgi:hypothetical protein